MKKSTRLIALSVVVVAGLLTTGKVFLVKDLLASADDFVESSTLAVSSDTATESTWYHAIHSSGETKAVRSLFVTADSSGRIATINFKAGNEVKKGDLLIELDSTSETINLDAAKVRLQKEESALQRAKQLIADGIIPRTQYEAASTAYELAASSHQSSTVRLSKKFVYAPFTGRVGIKKANVGEYISAGAPIVSLHAVDSLVFDFMIPQHRLGQVKTGLNVKVTTDAVPDQAFIGQITAINNEVDSTTRAVKVQATLSNPDGALLPGLFGSIEILLNSNERVVVVPASSVKYSTVGTSIFVLEENADNLSSNYRQAVERFVSLGPTRDAQVSVRSGILPGEEIVAAGVFKVKDGDTVYVHNKVNNSSPDKSDFQTAGSGYH